MTSAKSMYSPELISVSIAQVEKIRESFLRYVSAFHKYDDDLYNQHIEVKKIHTIDVCNEIMGIGNSLDFTREQIAFAEIIAWLHDIGRFEQFKNYGTFADAESENHSEIAVRVIEQQGLLKDFNNRQREIIYRSIRNHNLPQVPNNEPDIVRYYSQLLRDADKLDIWRVSIEMNIFHKIKTEVQPDVYDVPDDLLECFKNDRIIMLDQVHSFYDSILFRVSWIYDLNFRYSVQQVMERGIADQLIAKLPHSQALEKILAMVHSYMNRVLAEH